MNENVNVWDSSGKEIQSQLVPILDASLALRSYYVKAYLGVSPNVQPKYWLVFSALVPPLGFTTYYISSAKQSGYLFLISLLIEATHECLDKRLYCKYFVSQKQNLQVQHLSHKQHTSQEIKASHLK